MRRVLKLLFKAFDNRSGAEVTAAAITLHRGNLEAWPEGRLIARHVHNQGRGRSWRLASETRNPAAAGFRAGNA